MEGETLGVGQVGAVKGLKACCLQFEHFGVEEKKFSGVLFHR